MTLVRGVPLAGDALAALGNKLRTACGTLRDVLELQGEHRDRVVALLQAEGYTKAASMTACSSPSPHP